MTWTKRIMICKSDLPTWPHIIFLSYPQTFIIAHIIPDYGLSNCRFRSDDGHFLSDTDDEYSEDFEEWDELGNDN